MRQGEARESELLLDVASQIADDRQVDWQAVQPDGDESAAVEGLRLLETVARTYQRAAAGKSAGVDETVAVPRWGHLALLEKLGEGGFGEVYRAYDSVLDREIALKLRRSGPSADALGGQAYLEEARLLARVRHPNVLMVHGADIHDGRVGLWTDLIEGRTLEEILAAQGPMGPHEVVGIGAHLCQALAAVHREGLLHGDIKTSNVMRESGGRIVLMDFGASDRIPDPEGGPPLMVRGTPVAMAPEVLHGKPASQSSDIYSLGVLLYRLLTGEYPVEGEDFSTIVRAHDQRTQGSLRDARPDLPHDLVEIVEKAMDPVPDRRFPSAGAMETALRSTMPPVAEPEEKPQAAEPRSGSRLGHLTGVIAIGLLLSALAIFFASRGREQPSEVSLETGESSIAVLPLESTGTDQDYVAAGLTDALVAELAGFESLRLIAAGSVRRANGNGESPGEIGQKLGAAAVLTGRSLKSGDRVQVSLQLVDSASGEILWADQLERSLGDAFRMQREVALSVADAIHLELQGDERVSAEAVGIVPPDEADDYFRARHLWGQRKRESVERAIELYREILDRDPAFALAWSGLADAYATMSSWFWLPADEVIPLAKAAVERALQLDPELAEAHVTKAAILAEYDRDREQALEHWDRAIDLKPGYSSARSWYSDHLAYLQRFDEALEQARIAKEQDPLSPAAAQAVGTVLYYARRFDEAIEELDSASRQFPDFPFSRMYQGLAHLGRGDHERAIEILEELRGRRPDMADVTAVLSVAYGRTGDEERSRELLDEILALPEDRWGKAFLPVAPYAELGMYAEAMEALEQSYQERDWRLSFLAVEPIMEPLFAEPDFPELLRRLGLPEHPPADTR